MIWLLACTSAVEPGAGVPSALQGDWYGQDGRLLRVESHALGDYRSEELDGVWANDTFLFGSTSFDNRGTLGLCEGSLELEGGALVVELSGGCSELSGAYGRTAGPAEAVGGKTAPAKAPTAKAPPVKAPPAKAPPVKAAVDQCERYVDCVCDVAIAIRHRSHDDSYMASCDVARVLVDLGTKGPDCQQALVDMEPWFQGIEAAHPRVEIPKGCREGG